MEPDTATVVAIVSAIIAGLALLWAIFAHLSTRRVAKLTYAVSQLSDFGVPESFLVDMPNAPVAITVTSRGNKGTQNINLRIWTVSPISDYEVSPSDLQVTSNHGHLYVQSPLLNPSETIKLYLRCDGNPTANQIGRVELSHSEGTGINEHKMQAISISFMGIQFEYNPLDMRTQLVRIGPIRFR